MSDGRVLSGASATMIIARLTLKRLFRSRAIFFTAGLALLPVILAALVKRPGEQVWNGVFNLGIMVLCVAPPLHLASAIAEEIEDNTFTYLWSRPFPRWSVIIGKLVAIVPPLCALFLLTFTAAFYLAFGDQAGQNMAVLSSTLAAVCLTTVAVACVSIGLGSVVPKFPLVVSIVYLLVLDNTLRAIPVAIHNVSLTYNMKVIAGLQKGSATTAAVWLIAVAAMWFAVAMWRVRRTECQTVR